MTFTPCCKGTLTSKIKSGQFTHLGRFGQPLTSVMNCALGTSITSGLTSNPLNILIKALIHSNCDNLRYLVRVHWSDPFFKSTILPTCCLQDQENLPALLDSALPGENGCNSRDNVHTSCQFPSDQGLANLCGFLPGWSRHQCYKHVSRWFTHQVADHTRNSRFLATASRLIILVFSNFYAWPTDKKDAKSIFSYTYAQYSQFIWMHCLF